MRKQIIFLVLGLLLSLGSVQAQFWIQIGQDIDGDAAGDFCGYSVELSANGNIVAVGSDWNDGNGDKSGQVRIFENTAGSWTQIGESIYGEAANDLSGSSISLNEDGSIVAIGASGNDGDNNEYNCGHVRVYENINGNWTQIGQDIDGESFEDHSGGSVSLSADGSIVAIGANGVDVNGADYTGQVKVYENISGIWTQMGESINGDAHYDLFGSHISLSANGSRLAIGAHGNDGNGSASGQVKIFEYTSGSWTQMGEDIYGESSLDQSGVSVSINADGSIVAIGAIYNDGGFIDAGHVRVFHFVSDTWLQMGEDIDGEAEDDAFGSSVCLNSEGTKLIIGARLNDENGTDAGYAQVFEYNNESWVQLGGNILGENIGDESGNAVSMNADGTIIAVGSYKNDGNGEDAGHVRVYKDITTDITSINTSETIIYPNPSSGKLYFNLDNYGEILITDITGKKVLYTSSEMNTGSFTLDISKQSAGVYFVRIKTDLSQQVIKIIKN